MSPLLFLISAIVTAHFPNTTVTDLSSLTQEMQVTHASYNHILTNVAVWSPSSEWLVYDIRSPHGGFDGNRIERVNIDSKRVEVLYESKNGANCGVVTYNPQREEVIFIHGPENPTEGWEYGFSRRFGTLVDTSRPGHIRYLEATNYAPPYQAGALRGGTHVHVFSADGNAVSFTYDDEVLTQAEAAGGPGEPNQRNVGVAISSGPISVNLNHPRNHDGDYFSFVATRTEAEPKSGSDEISKACEESWIGMQGYRKNNGTWQRQALAFQGTVTREDGGQHVEVFIVDLPEDCTKASHQPLEGTNTQRPAPPAGTIQRRLTFTGHRTHPGLQGPRHWLRSAPDGECIGFLMKDDAGIVQFWTVSPNGGQAIQQTTNSEDIASAFTWSPDGRLVAYVMDKSVCVTDITKKQTYRLTARADKSPMPDACVISPDGQSIAYLRPTSAGINQIFIVNIPSQLLSH